MRAAASRFLNFHAKSLQFYSALVNPRTWSTLTPLVLNTYNIYINVHAITSACVRMRAINDTSAVKTLMKRRDNNGRYAEFDVSEESFARLESSHV